MQKPTGFDEIQTNGEFTPVNLGGHTAIIKRVQETTSKNGRPMLQIALDFDAKDPQAGYFKQAFDSDNRADKKWPFQGTQYILTEDQDGKCSRSFKGFITSVEESNKAECQWGDDFENWFKNKKVGVVFGEVEEEYNGEIKTRRRIRYFCSYDKAKAAPVPAKKMFRGERPAAKPVDDGFMSIPATVEEEIPF